MKFKLVLGVFLSFLILSLPLIAASEVPGVSVKPGNSYIWQMNRREKENEQAWEESTLYRLINVTKVVTEIETTEITYNEYIANASEYEENDLTAVSWNETNTDEKLFLNNTDPMNNFGGFVSLETADLRDIEDLNQEEQANFLDDIMTVASPEYASFVLLMWVVAFTSGFLLADVEYVNSTSIDSVSENSIEGSLMRGYNIMYEISDEWLNLSTTIDFSLEYSSSDKLLTSSTIDVTYSETSYNDTANAYQTDTLDSQTEASLVYPKQGFFNEIMDTIKSIPSFPVELLGIFLIGTTIGLIYWQKKRK